MNLPDVRRITQWDWQGMAPDDAILCDAPLKYEAARHRRRANSARRNGRIKTCGCTAKYTINDIPFCRKHASLKLLEMMDPGPE